VRAAAERTVTTLDLDTRLTFDNYIVGTSNRLAAAAARRMADAPGAAYNPLFLYSASGLGKTHLLMAIGNHLVRAYPDITVVYDTLDNLMEGVMSSIEAGDRDAFRGRLRDVTVLLLDDVQFLAGRRAAQEELLRAWDSLSARGGQVVLASDRPPNEIDDIDQRLLSRFSGGLIADLNVPDFETRVAIVRQKVEERSQQLAAGVAETLAKVAFSSVRELQGALHRVLAVQELDNRPVDLHEVARILGMPAPEPAATEPATHVADTIEIASGAVPSPVPEQKLAGTILRWEKEGYRTHRLEAAMTSGSFSAREIELLIQQFEAAASRLKAIAAAIAALDASAAELLRHDVLRNPDRIEEAESMLEHVRERMRPLPAPPDAPDFDTLALDPGLLAVRAARAVAQEPGERYNPFFVHGPAGTGKRALVTALTLLYRDRHDPAVAFLSGREFSAELIGAIKRNQVESWRTRYRRARLIVIDGVDALMDTERAQEELFHLFDNARRAGVQLVFTASRPPSQLRGFEDRLRTRLEGGLVVDLVPTSGPEAVPARQPAASEPAPHAQPDDWFFNREKLLWRWPYMQDWLMQDAD
jgi:chromosomal replication initiator protein